MDEPLQQEVPQEQQEQPKLEFIETNEEQGGIRRRLRDRDLLRKRKAEAEEKETNQWDFGTESPKKRGRSGSKRGRRRGRPRKTNTTKVIDPTDPSPISQTTPAAVAGPIFTQGISGQTPSALTPLLETSAVSTAPANISYQLAQFNPSVRVQAPVSESVVDTALTPVPTVAPVFQDLSQEVRPAYAEPPSKPELDQILIEDLGPDEEEDLGQSQDNGVEEDLNGKPEANTFFSNPTLSSPPPPPQEYVPGNSI